MLIARYQSNGSLDTFLTESHIAYWKNHSSSHNYNSNKQGKLTMPEFQEGILIQWNLHLTKTLGTNNMIIGIDLLEFLQIDLRFLDQIDRWGERSTPFKEIDAFVMEAYHIHDEGIFIDSSKRI